MKIFCQAALDFACEPKPIFELMVDDANFPGCFTGFGLIPAIRSIRLAEPLAVGVVRHIYNADNSVLVEKISLLEKPHRHSYTLSGFQAPFSWLVKQGESDWQLNKTASGTRVNWTYEFTLTSFLVYPFCFVLLKFFMQKAMHRCLRNMDTYCNDNRKHD
ncbi:MAG: SRPBCC family protein [Arenimonas sp.]